tara:strand:- start:299 stop:745 length:447 start_codon:yes stop_codon:yes gene_type:complete
MPANAQHYLEGTMYFPYLFDVKDKFDRYSVALALEGDQLAQARKIGLNIKQEEGKMDGLPYVQLKSNYEPKLFDADGKEYKGPRMLSNGSKAAVRVSQKPYNNKYGTGVTTFLNAVKITDPIEYVGDGNDQSFGTDAKKDDLSDDIPF